MASHVLDLTEIDRSLVALAGGKAAHLGELARIDGVRVPPGFCVTTGAFERIIAGVPAGRLAGLRPDDREAIRAASAEVRRAVRAIAVPDDVAAAIVGRVDGETAYAVRSSATAEDTPTASFAGQHDSYLGVVGAQAVLDHVRRCWASLFTERAVAYRLRHGIDHGSVRMAVLVQRLVPARAAGVLFTADPVSGNRRVTSIEAVPGLAEGLVSGRVDAEAARVRDGVVSGGGTVLAEGEIRGLAALGRRIERHFGRPQDVEWCLDDAGIVVVQSRPITTLFPVPAAQDDANRVYLSVGHQQMMTEAMKPLGLAVWKLTSPGHMVDAGGRLFVDVTPRLASAAGRAGLFELAGRSDPLTGDALRTIVERDFIALEEPGEPAVRPPTPSIEPDPAIVAELVAMHEAALATLRREIVQHTGAGLLDFIRADIERLRQTLFTPRSLQAIMAGLEATWWLNEHLEEWLGERNAADALNRSVSGNVTSEMGLALLDVADAIRPYPEMVLFLRDAGDDFLDRLAGTEGGARAAEAVRGFLDRYGMRCVGEIDISRPRWGERPAAILPMILSNVDNFAAGEAERIFERGRREAESKEREILAELRRRPGGERRAAETKEKIDLVRVFAGYREYPKYHMVSRYQVYRLALLAEADRLVAGGVLGERDDVFLLSCAELYDVVRTGHVDRGVLRERAEAHAWHRTLTPPRVLTSEGEVLNGRYRREGLPDGALVGLGVSAGTVEGRARVVFDVAGADLEVGDILVTPYTDPSWTPVFVVAAGVVTEVGGLMTHGSVIAREYGVPAVVGVAGACAVIRDGQRIRVHGGDGYVEVLG